MFKELFETDINEGKIVDFIAGIKAKLKDKKLDKEAQKFYQKAEDELEKAHNYDFADPARFPYEEKFLQYMQKAREIESKINKD